MAGSPLIALPPDPASPESSTVAGDAWWPAIDRNAARDALRLGEIVTDPRLVSALEGAWLTITSDLAEWQADLAQGIPYATPPVAAPTSLSLVTAAQLAALHSSDSGGLHARGYDAGWGYDCDRRPMRPRYSPSRAAWLAGTMTDSATGATSARLVVLFTRAVRFSAAAELVELYRDMGMTTKADARAESMLSTGGDYRRMAIEHVRDILGVTRVTSELI